MTRLAIILSLLFVTPVWAETLRCSGMLTVKNWGIPLGSERKIKVFAVKRSGDELYIDGAYCSINGPVYRCHLSVGFGGVYFREFDRNSMRLVEKREISKNQKLQKIEELFEANCSFARPKF